jgi:carboxyl-terminal processing protease
MAPSRRRRSAALVLSLVLTCSVPVSGAQDVTSEAPASPRPTLDEALVDEALAILGERFVDAEALDSETLTAGAIRGMLEALGDEGHTEYLTREELAAAREALDGRVMGIGVILDQRASAPLVISVIDGSPADRAGLRAGDLIVEVDGVSTSRLPEDALGPLVRGEAGTNVELTVERAGASGPLSFAIVREDVAIQPASWARVPESDVAVVRIVQFSSGAGEAARAAIQDALSAGARAIVLDLRGDPGGLVAEALEVAAAFLDGGVAYQEQGRKGAPRPVDIPPGRLIAPDTPLVVLVDYATASSAEILAAALRDNGRAPIVGEQTFGTGTVVHTFDLADGSALKVGVLTWLTPRGEAVFRVGIRPDHEVAARPGAVTLRPRDLQGMSPAELAQSDDLPLLRAIGMLEPVATA